MTKHDRDSLPEGDRPLYDLLRLLEARSYRFVTPTPATHARVVARPDRRHARSIEDALGWSLPFAADLMPADILRCLGQSDMIEETPAGLHSRLRVSSLGERLFLHSAYPTDGADAVFFGPDSYRFADLIRRELAAGPPRDGARMVDIGTGAGVGAIVAADMFPGARMTMTDINPKALRLARINAAAAGVATELREGAGLAGMTDPVDVAMINPPYIIDGDARAYRDGGGMRGGEVAITLAGEAMDRLAPGGRVLLYTGSAIHDGQDALAHALGEAAAARHCTMRYAELDPDVFGEELDNPQYRDVDRIALVSAIFQRGE